MGRKCSHYGSIGHNSRTCGGYRALLSFCAAFTSNDGGLRLLGVQLDLSSTSSPSPSSPSSSSSVTIFMKKSFSLDSRSSPHVSNSGDNRIPTGYLSNRLTAGSQDKRKGELLVENRESFLVHVFIITERP